MDSSYFCTCEVYTISLHAQFSFFSFFWCLWNFSCKWHEWKLWCCMLQQSQNVPATDGGKQLNEACQPCSTTAISPSFCQFMCTIKFTFLGWAPYSSKEVKYLVSYLPPDMKNLRALSKGYSVYHAIWPSGGFSVQWVGRLDEHNGLHRPICYA